MKKKWQKKIIFFLATQLGWLLIWLLGKLTRIRVVNQETWNRLQTGNTGLLVLLWHGRMVLPFYFHRFQGVVAMISQHEDGEMIARTAQKLGYLPVRGSSTRGGRRALTEMVQALKQGKVGTLMPDGPRGPRHELKAGALYIAQLAQVPILPMTYAARPAIQFKSWDHFLLLRPFSKSVIVYGEPVTVPRRLTPEELEAWRKKLELQMIELEEYADTLVRK